MGLDVRVSGLERKEAIEGFSFTLWKVSKNGEVSGETDVTSYLDLRMCQPRTNRSISQGDSVVYTLRKLKVGAWAKTSSREGASFVLKGVLQTTSGRHVDVASDTFEIYSHQSQLPSKKDPSKRSALKSSAGTTATAAPSSSSSGAAANLDGGGPLKKIRSSSHPLSRSLDSAMLLLHAAHDVFGLHSLSDAALVVGSSDETSAVPSPMDAEVRKAELLGRAEDIRQRIKALQEEEEALRSEASKLNVGVANSNYVSAACPVTQLYQEQQQQQQVKQEK